MGTYESPEDLRRFEIEQILRFMMMSDQDLVYYHNSSCGIRAFNQKVGIIMRCRHQEFLERGIDTSLIFKSYDANHEAVSHRKCGVWLAVINGKKTLAGTEIEMKNAEVVRDTSFSNN